jgi:outer membrane protein
MPLRNHIPALAAGLALCLACSGLQADALGLRAGAGYWSGDLSGEALNKTNRANTKPVSFDQLKMGDQSYNSFWLEFEHPVPVIPNLRMAYTNIESSKRGQVKEVFRSGDTTFTILRELTATLVFDTLDATAYYEVLDNWVSLDVGLTARLIDGYLDLVYERTLEDALPRSYTGVQEVLPMLYLNTRIDIPATGFYVQAQGNGASLQSDTFYDVDIRAGYDLDLKGLDLGVFAGYRVMRLKTQNISTLYADAELTGPQLGFGLHF